MEPTQTPNGQKDELVDNWGIDQPGDAPVFTEYESPLQDANENPTEPAQSEVISQALPETVVVNTAPSEPNPFDNPIEQLGQKLIALTPEFAKASASLGASLQDMSVDGILRAQFQAQGDAGVLEQKTQFLDLDTVERVVSICAAGGLVDKKGEAMLVKAVGEANVEAAKTYARVFIDFNNAREDHRLKYRVFEEQANRWVAKLRGETAAFERDDEIAAVRHKGQLATEKANQEIAQLDTADVIKEKQAEMQIKDAARTLTTEEARTRIEEDKVALGRRSSVAEQENFEISQSRVARLVDADKLKNEEKRVRGGLEVEGIRLDGSLKTEKAGARLSHPFGKALLVGTGATAFAVVAVVFTANVIADNPKNASMQPWATINNKWDEALGPIGEGLQHKWDEVVHSGKPATRIEPLAP